MKNNATWLKPASFCSLFFLVLAVYGQVGHHDFVSFDDGRYVYENPVVMQGLTLQGIKWAFSFTDVAYWHPVTWLSHMLDCELFGLDPGPPHLINLLLHMINVGLVFFLLRNLTGAYWKSLLVAGLFALHPMNVEYVAWLAERKNLLSTLLGLFSLIAYILYKETHRVKPYAASLVLYLLGLMAKPALVVYPVLMLLMDFWMSREQKGTPEKAQIEHQSVPAIREPFSLGRIVFEKIPFFVLAILTTVLASLSMSRRGIDIGLEAVSLPNRLANAIISINGYIGKLFWPNDLVVFYPYPESISWIHLGLALVVFIGISILTVAGFRKASFLIFGWGWFLVALLPMLGFKQAGLWPALADRWAYVPYIGLFVIVVWGCAFFWVKKGASLKSAALAGLVVLAMMTPITYRQVTHWQNSLTLFEHAVTADPNNDVAHNNLGVAFFHEGEVNQALYHFLTALKIQPGYQAAHDNLAACLAQLGHGNNLTAAVRQLVDQNPGMPALHYHLGTLYEETGAFRSAEKAYEKALEIEPGYVQALNMLCRVLMKQRNYPKALAMLKIRASVKPVNAAVFYDIARIYAHFGDPGQAIRWLTKCKEKGFDNWQQLEKDTMFNSLRGNPSFRKLQNL